ncbi:NAD(P)-binding protein [Flammeovirga agarivorans]|uniref:NAD(P)-binding protein n=1 Tax=Flammeovirga agarivorans TaxID=2726742 RepID=A0A7X8SQ17_9BACT|nr:NAD(P)-binding protein [Flammeovirga agarivorans]NLR94286.1 NAD(P)-binding protein [Flammeovirga agarivorans]
MKKIAIFGGGIAGLTTAWELTNQKDWEKKYDITIYQQGWRCGGKASTGINEQGRIEEIGIHMFQGWYHNAFRLVKEVYSYIEENKINEDGAFKSWKDAFKANPVTSLVEPSKDDKWLDWPFVLPENNLEPGSIEDKDISVSIQEFIALGLETLLGSPYQKNKAGKVAFKNRMLNRLFFKQHISKSDAWWMKRIISIFESLSNDITSNPDNKSVKRIIASSERVIKLLKSNVIANALDKSNALRRIRELLILVLVSLKGVFSDVYEETEFNWSNINHYDFSEWLSKHGADDQIINSSIVRFLYKGTFSNMLNGEKGKVAADIAINMMLMIPSYKGSFVWNLVGGTGGSFIAPLFVALRHKGIKFKFFHQLNQVNYSDGKEIESIKLDRQVDLQENIKEYNPIVKQKGVFQWRTTPDLNQINPIQAKQIEEGKVNLESHWSEWKNVDSLQLSKGVDFDIAVLATSIKPLKYICKDIVESKQEWKNMVENVEASATANVQFWLKKDDQELGMDLGEWGMKEKSYANTVIYDDPLYSWTTMTFVSPYEKWQKGNEAKQISYWCGTWPNHLTDFDKSKTSYPADQITLLKKVAKEYMNKNMGWIWPNAVKDNQFDYALLCDSQEEETLEEKFNNQFFLTNIDPSMHYVIARPGSNKYRLKADETGYDNLYFSGDWINFGLNVGYMEGTVIAGKQAAKCISNAISVSKDIVKK